MGDAGRAAGQEQRYAQAAAFGPALERLARAYERDPDKRCDLLQEIHVALWRSLARFDGRCSHKHDGDPLGWVEFFEKPEIVRVLRGRAANRPPR